MRWFEVSGGGYQELALELQGLDIDKFSCGRLQVLVVEVYDENYDRALVYCLSSLHMMTLFSMLYNSSTRQLAARWLGLLLQRWRQHSLAKQTGLEQAPLVSVMVGGHPDQDSKRVESLTLSLQ